jgi:hypothetical protein
MNPHGRPPKGRDMQRCAFWLPAALIARIDRYAHHLQAERPDTVVTRADALRKLVSDALSASASARAAGRPAGNQRRRTQRG